MNIIFIGMSGSGKTTIGKKTSTILGMEFYDTDEIIGKKIKMEIDSFFEKYGEEKFRIIEENIIGKLSEKKHSIISTGGGAILSDINMKNLKKNGIFIYLKGSLETLVSNLEKSKVNRPLLNDLDNIICNIHKMYENRKYLYDNYADYKINIDNKTIEEIVNEVKKINKTIESHD